MRNELYRAFDQVQAGDDLVTGTQQYLRREIARRQNQKCKPAPARALLAWAAILLVIGIGGFSAWSFSRPDTYVSIDVNPSLELSLNRGGRVVGAYPFNAEAGRVLEAVSLKGRTLDRAMEDLVSYMESDGYLRDGGLISVTVYSGNTARQATVHHSLQGNLERALQSRGLDAELEVSPVSGQLWEAAHGCHTTPAKYTAIQQLIEVDPDAGGIDQYQGHSISDIRQRIRECQNGHDNASGKGGGHRHGHGKSNNSY